MEGGAADLWTGRPLINRMSTGRELTRAPRIDMGHQKTPRIDQ